MTLASNEDAVDEYATGTALAWVAWNHHQIKAKQTDAETVCVEY